MKRPTTPLTLAERRALCDFQRYPTYRGMAACGSALLRLEQRGYLRSIERGADERPLYFLTAKGKKVKL